MNVDNSEENLCEETKLEGRKDKSYTTTSSIFGIYSISTNKEQTSKGRRILSKANS